MDVKSFTTSGPGSLSRLRLKRRNFFKPVFRVDFQMRACSGGHADVAGILFKQNPASIKIRNFYGETCLDLAARSANPKLAETLEQVSTLSAFLCVTDDPDE
jgi:hypothetical protein